MNQIQINTLFLIAVLSLLPTVAANSTENKKVAQQTENFRSKEFAFKYPTNFRVSMGGHGTAIRVAPPFRSAYWEDTIVIQKHNKQIEECDLPQSSQPDSHDMREIAGRRAYAYSGEDAAMNRFTREKGYVIETRTSCWRFELIRRGRPYQKLDLAREEMKRLDKQSDRDAKAASTAFKTILDSFVFLRPER